MDEPITVDPTVIATGLRIIRKRRWFLWSLIIAYIPGVWTSLTLTGSDKATAVFFGIWLVLLIIAVCFVKHVPLLKRQALKTLPVEVSGDIQAVKLESPIFGTAEINNMQKLKIIVGR